MNLIPLTGPNGEEYLVPENRLRPYHTITLGRGSWHMAHPITCDLGNCEFDRVAVREAEAWAIGEYRWDDPDGELTIIENPS